MKINGEEVIFDKSNKVHTHENEGGSLSGWRTVCVSRIEQHWHLPILKLHGFVYTDQSLKSIEEAIQREVNFDLQMRERKSLGLPTWKFPNWCR